MILEELKAHAPEVLEPLEKEAVKAFHKLPKISLDYAVMETTNKAYVLPAPFTWDDLGDWTALERLLGAEGQNVELAKHVGLDTNKAIFDGQTLF